MRVVWLYGLLLCAQVAGAADGRLLGSGGVLSVDGAAGGGLVPWAVIAGHSEGREWDVSAAASMLDSGDYDVRAAAVALGWRNRLELSFARLSLGLDGLVERGRFPDRRLDADVIGAKWRLAGDLVYERAPQLAIGMQWRRSRDAGLVGLAGAEDDRGVDVYLAASKLWIAGIGGRRTLASLALRSTQAHQLGLLGFDDTRSLTLEGSLAVFLHPHWLLGLEYRGKPDRLGFAPEDDWADLFVAWLPDKQVHLAFGYADLGSVGGLDGQRGWYLSLRGAAP
ncbi:MAG: DUF3034 family protein [Xanthomonadales bacterium]|nr:hypothetical protein [Xanthomonadales bacterium]MCC6593919.1 DUF3034 family protein [Xanthomonadales bacterium]MCE7932057.1 DUF3034 family protein [Xanthomonadales bacterium PRO6]